MPDPKPLIVAPTRPIVPLWLAALLAIAAGPLLDAAFPDLGLWPAIFPGVAIALVALIGRRLGTAYLIGFLTSLSFYLVHIPWISKFLGDDFPFPLDLTPLIALSVFEAFFWGAAAMLLTLAYRWIPRAFPTFWGRVLLLPAAIAGIWTLREFITSNWPWGGFSWGRLAFSQSESPLGSLFPWIGVAGVTFVIAFLTASAVEAIRVSSRRTWLTAATTVVAAATVTFAFPTFPVETQGTLRVAAVQGNGPAGYFTPHVYGDLLRAQFDATQSIVPGKRKLDVIVWPEGASDVDPLENRDAANIFDFISNEYDAPLIAGTIAQRGKLTFNTSLLWEAGRGAVDHYDKRHPVPFGEYVPARSFFEPLSPDLIGLIGRDYTPGTTDPILTVKAAVGAVKVGVNICFDIVDDFLMTETIDDGAQVIFAQSNNADFGRTDESVQQLAIARVRAMELGRSVVVNSTVGQSAVILPDGSTLDSVKRYTAATMVDDVPLSTVVTPAVVISHPLEWFLAAFGLATLVIAFGATRQRRPRT
ncbi:apolipoprotein N-acyltransferase [soil metagenome]